LLSENADTNYADEIEFRPSATAFFLKSGFGWLLIAATIASAGLLAFVTLPLALLVAIRYKTTKFSLTADRLFLRSGIIFCTEEEIELYRVKDARANFSVIQQMFGNGDLVISSSDGAGFGDGKRAVISVPNVPQVRAIREELRNRVEATRSKRGVREIDLG
jgi:uncharacterized membrane protein YdbT with pleckstrin-like domain